ncbi:MAG: hypothetical protein M0Z67_11120 [Nitrospiraceae bacterium]|nr:hypothetical protein [Nitrospiraceae bacterium]
MGVKGLAEGIILQSIEDLWNENLRDECIAFFRGKEFSICAEIAGMNLADQIKLLGLVKGIVNDGDKGTKQKRTVFGEKTKRPSKMPRRLHRFLQAVP